MSNNQDLTDLLALDLGISILNRRPHATEIFKWQDIDLLPHSSLDTMLCEIFEWNGRAWRTTDNNLIGYIFPPSELQKIKTDLMSIPKHEALIPDFEFTREQILELGFSLPSLFNIGFKGNLNSSRQISIKVNKVTKSRISNVDPLGLNIMKALSEFAQNESKLYRKQIKFNYLTRALFYAESVEIFIEKEVGSDLDVTFDTNGVGVNVENETNTSKKVKLHYLEHRAPFAANFILGKEFNL